MDLEVTRHALSEELADHTATYVANAERRAHEPVLVRLIAVLCVVVDIAACGQVVSPPAPSVAGPTAVPRSADPTREPPRYAPTVPDPKDARGIGGCDLLTSPQLAELGLARETARSEAIGAGEVCVWEYQAGRNSASLQISTERTIPGLDGIYLSREALVQFEPVTVAGHPGFRGDQVAGDCTLYIAIADYQLMSVDGNLAGDDLPDRCALARRMGELILSNLPPLTE